MTPFNKKNIVFFVFLLAFLYLLTEFLCFGTLRILDKNFYIKYRDKKDDLILKKEIADSLIKIIEEDPVSVIKYDSILGWNIAKNYITPHVAHTNGIRSDRLFSKDKPKGKIRILTMGDSFTYCYGVKNNSTWQYFLREIDKLEILNFGVPGYGLDQAYLKYMIEGKLYKADIVLIGFMSENINRNVNTFRPFYSPQVEIPFSKPRFKVKNDELILLPNHFKKISDYKTVLDSPFETLSELAKNDYFYNENCDTGKLDILPSVRLFKIFKKIHRQNNNGIIKKQYYNIDSEAFLVTTKIFDRFVHDVIKNKAIPIIIIFPNKQDILRYRKNKTRRYEPLLKYLSEKKYYYIDAMDFIDNYCSNCDINILIDEHYSPITNKLVASAIINYIKNFISKN